MMGWYDWDQMIGAGWIAMAVTGLLLLAVIIGALVLLARDDEPPPRDVPPAQSADEVLDERLARGDITPEEYRQRADVLHAVRPRPTPRV